jgi:type-F conjugative transfer system pilin assembly protein TrbC
MNSRTISPTLICAASLLLSASVVQGQTLLESMRPVQWSTLIFVSTKMPRESLVTLARQAQRTRATLVLNGFQAGHVGMGEAQQWVGQLNLDCCGPRGGAAFEIDPKKFQQYAIKSVPAFVITASDDASPGQWTKVSGDMDLGNAFKFFANQSQLKKAREYAEISFKKL